MNEQQYNAACETIEKIMDNVVEGDFSPLTQETLEALAKQVAAYEAEHFLTGDGDK